MLLDELQSIARTGLHYAESEYDRERYERLAVLAAREYGAWSGRPEPEIRRRWAEEVGQITPKVGADVAIVDAAERFLLVRRADDGRWGLVAGWLDPGETPAEAARREVREEVGLDVRIDALVDAVGRPARAEWGPYAVVSVVFLATIVGGEVRTQPHEVLEARWWSLDDVPAWHHNHEALARAALVAHRRRRHDASDP